MHYKELTHTYVLPFLLTRATGIFYSTRTWKLHYRFSVINILSANAILLLPTKPETISWTTEHTVAQVYTNHGYIL
jgi:hypothetical protein